MMAALAGYRDDISGSLATTGTASAYLVTTNQGLPNPPTDGQMIAITVNITNGINPTLSADGGGTFPIQASAGVGIPAGTLILGSPYSLKFSLSNNAWLLRDFYSSSLTVPLGGMIPYTLATVPNSNFVFPAGQCLSTTTYAAYWTALGSPASGTCAGGQFRIIDMSGTLPAGLDTMPGFTAAGRLTTAATGCGTAMTSVGVRCANGSQSHTLTAAQIPTITASGSGSASVNSTVSTVLSPSITNWANGSGITLTAFNPGGATAGTLSSTGSASVSTTSNNTGGGAHSIVMPVIGVTYLLRVI
jgi:hypothetical protein